jgi:lipid A 4'-phosphatase
MTAQESADSHVFRRSAAEHDSVVSSATEASQSNVQDGSAKQLSTPQTLLFLLVPTALLLLLTVAFRWSDADRAISRHFFLGEFNAWSGLSSSWCKAIYDYSVLPAYAMGLGGLVVAVGSFAWPALRAYRFRGLFLAVLLLVGPGLLVNGLFKPYWHRPRPKHIVDFGGDLKFVAVWSRSASWVNSKSFPSGHASMGFYLMAPAFFLYRRHLRQAAGWFGLGISAGLLVGLVRISQGAHFASDVAWSGGMVFSSGVFLIMLFEWLQWRDNEDPADITESSDTPRRAWRPRGDASANASGRFAA